MAGQGRKLSNGLEPKKTGGQSNPPWEKTKKSATDHRQVISKKKGDLDTDRENRPKKKY